MTKTFREMITAEFGVPLNWNALFNRQVEAYATDAADSLTEYVRSIGDARIDGGWNWS